MATKTKTKTTTTNEEIVIKAKNDIDSKNIDDFVSIEDQTYNESFLALVERNQIPLSRTLVSILYLSYFLSNQNTTTKTLTSKFLFLQNKVGKDIYDIHIDDVYYVINWVITLTFLRSFLMKYIFEPFAYKFINIHSKKAKTRFAEQSWSFIYYSISFIYGVILYIQSPYFNNLDQIYINWPNYFMTSSFKNYYLISMAFWLQQIFVLNVEKPRKDHYQMFSHHIITCLLIIGSYYYYYFRIGHLILMIMDSVDIFLAGAKMLKYAKFNTLCDTCFIFFLISWIVLRHGVYNYIFYHAWYKSTELMKDGKCIMGAVQKRCWTPAVINTFLGLLGGLQIITCIWMYLILKVAYKVIIGIGAEDVRSDEDDTEEEDVAAEEDEEEFTKDQELFDEIEQGKVD
ncbi:unnamed protein product [Candida verbasci]|uniref:TLC domain-containing protein n=1 Tax=Candida verbasci TaxID=1227364 RepID=A0A9W4TXG5_9ASCO|nr:unnamed protein product [Candida verbasci]